MRFPPRAIVRSPLGLLFLDGKGLPIVLVGYGRSLTLGLRSRERLDGLLGLAELALLLRLPLKQLP